MPSCTQIASNPQKNQKTTKSHTKETKILIDKKNLNKTQHSFFHRIFLLVSPTSFLLSVLLPNSSPECLLGSSPTLILELPLVPLLSLRRPVLSSYLDAMPSLHQLRLSLLVWSASSAFYTPTELRQLYQLNLHLVIVILNQRPRRRHWRHANASLSPTGLRCFSQIIIMGKSVGVGLIPKGFQEWAGIKGSSLGHPSRAKTLRVVLSDNKGIQLWTKILCNCSHWVLPLAVQWGIIKGRDHTLLLRGL